MELPLDCQPLLKDVRVREEERSLEYHTLPKDVWVHILTTYLTFNEARIMAGTSVYFRKIFFTWRANVPRIMVNDGKHLTDWFIKRIQAVSVRKLDPLARLVSRGAPVRDVGVLGNFTTIPKNITHITYVYALSSCNKAGCISLSSQTVTHLTLKRKPTCDILDLRNMPALAALDLERFDDTKILAPEGIQTLATTITDSALDWIPRSVRVLTVKNDLLSGFEFVVPPFINTIIFEGSCVIDVDLANVEHVVVKSDVGPFIARSHQKLEHVTVHGNCRVFRRGDFRGLMVEKVLSVVGPTVKHVTLRGAKSPIQVAPTVTRLTVETGHIISNISGDGLTHLELGPRIVTPILEFPATLQHLRASRDWVRTFASPFLRRTVIIEEY